MPMTIEMITEGLRKLLLENNYNPSTIKFYEREWNKIKCFLMEEYGDTEYQMERGLKYLEKQYGFITKYNDGTLTQQRVQLLRVVHMLEDYSLHKVLTRRYHASKNPIRLNEYYGCIFQHYCAFLDVSELHIHGNMQWISQDAGWVQFQNCRAECLRYKAFPPASVFHGHDYGRFCRKNPHAAGF